ncbi:hypothetical protein [Oceanirhabdus sp. W0125-5]|nr:hypothetical protein [Oceanirhabdus sp. W0125-5]WBW95969.1 hypothetical protein OW730_20085 [Oceanirhabdus sp. W0125-5]
MKKNRDKIVLFLCLLLIASLGLICNKVYNAGKEAGYKQRMEEYRER